MKKQADNNTFTMFLKLDKLLVLILLVTLFACETKSPEHEPTEPYSTSEWDFDIEFPTTDFEVSKTDRTHPDFPESHASNWIMEGYKDSSYFMYFVAKDIIGKSQSKDVKLFEDGYYELLESVLGGGMKNYNAINIQYQKNECDSLFAMTAVADYFGTSGNGNIILKSFTNGHQLIILGAVAMQKDVLEQDRFFKSLKIKTKSI